MCDFKLNKCPFCRTKIVLHDFNYILITSEDQYYCNEEETFSETSSVGTIDYCDELEEINF
jgi:hypothetical protein